MLSRLLDRTSRFCALADSAAASWSRAAYPLEKGDRVYAKYAGFDYATLGTRSGAHFVVVVYGTLSAAYDRKARAVEYGVGAHQAKALRGCQPRKSPATCSLTSHTYAVPSPQPEPSTPPSGVQSTAGSDHCQAG